MLWVTNQIQFLKDIVYQFERILRQLEALGVKIENSYYYSMIKLKMPQHIRIKLINIDHDQTNEWKTNSIRKYLKQYVTSIEKASKPK